MLSKKAKEQILDHAIENLKQKLVKGVSVAHQEHPDPQVCAAIVRLNDALCSWERMTFRESVLIIREQGGFVHRSVSGKPGVPEDVTDEQLMGIIEN